MRISATRLPDEDDRIDVADWGIEPRDRLLEFVNQTMKEVLAIIVKEPARVHFGDSTDDPTELEISLPFGSVEGDCLTWVVSLRKAVESIVNDCKYPAGREDALRLRNMLAALVDQLDTALTTNSR